MKVRAVSLVMLPGQLFSTTQIRVCLWFLAKDKSNGLIKDITLRDRRRETLFIDARKLGAMETRTLKVLTEDDVAKIAGTYHAWREKGGRYADQPGFCRAVTTDEIAAKGFILTPGRCVGTAQAEEDSEPIDAKMARLTSTLRAQLEVATSLDDTICRTLAGVGHGW